MNTRRGLGRGLGALIPTAPQATPAAPGSESAPPNQSAREPLHNSIDILSGGRPYRGSQGLSAPAEDLPADSGALLREIATNAIRPNPRQPRQNFDEEALTELAQSIALVGLLQPVVVRPASAGDFELIMGERRWRAAQQAGLATIPAIVRETSDDALLRDALLENLLRAQLNPLEEAAAYQQMVEDFGVTHEELAVRIGRSRPHISNTIRLLRLSPTVQRRVAAGVLSAGHARALLTISDPVAQDVLAGRVTAEGMSVRGLEELLAAGEAEQKPAGRRSRAAGDPGLAEIARRLSERFETRCRVERGARTGRITIEFAGAEDLDRILIALEPFPA